MFQAVSYEGTRSEQHTAVLGQLSALIRDEPSAIANLANAAALLNVFLTDTNWVGFYLYDGKELVLGPFQGCLPASVFRSDAGYAAHLRRNDVHSLLTMFMLFQVISPAMPHRTVRLSCLLSKTANYTGCSISTARSKPF